MKRNYWSIISILLILIVFIISLSGTVTVEASDYSQMPTINIPTVTGTPTGPLITVKQDAEQDQINVRSGPGTFYDKVGVLLTGQQAPAKGKSVGGEWILIDYPGVVGGTAWVYAPLVDLTPGSLPIVEPPPTPTPLVTPTIDPTLAAQFIVTSAPTRLPTFTEPAPLVIPTFTDNAGSRMPGGIPVGLIIFSLAGLGILVGLFTLSQRR